MIEKRKFRNFAPPLLRRPVRHVLTVLHRIKNYIKIFLNIRGVSRIDQDALNASLLLAPHSIWLNLDEYQIPHVQKSCTVISRGIGVFNVRANTDDLYHLIPGREAMVEVCIRCLLPSGGVFVDAGANIGYYSIIASSLVGVSGKVFSIEMVSDTFSALKSNLVLNSCLNVVALEGALSSTHGSLVKVNMPAGRFGCASMVKEGSEGVEDVSTLRLDRILASTNAEIDCLKMDLEGAEYGALMGAKGCLKRVNSIVFENAGDCNIFEFLRQHDFCVMMIDTSNALAIKADLKWKFNQLLGRFDVG